MLNKWTILLLTVAMIPASLMGQQDPQARQILDELSARYAQASSFRASLSQSISNSTEGLNEVVSGSIVVQGNKYVIRMPGQEVANDGERVYVYLAEVNEITIDYYYPEEGEIAPSTIFDLYKAGCKYQYVGTESIQGAACHVIDLVPEAADTQFFRIRLFVRGNDYALVRYEMYDRASTRYTYEFTNLQFNIPVQDAEFVFSGSSHPGADVVDLTEG